MWKSFYRPPTTCCRWMNPRSLDYFKRKAGVRKGSYQRMIRNLLDYYVAQQG